MELFFDSKKNSKHTEQAEVYKNLKDTFKDNLNSNSLNEICIINKEWYKKWKKSLQSKYTSVSSINYLNSPLQIRIKEIPNKELGNTIQLKQCFNSYEDIFTGPNYFFVNNVKEQVLTKEIFIIDEAMKFNIKIISKEMWNYFYGVCGGGPRIQRFVCQQELSKTNKKKLLLCNYVFYKKIQFYILIKNDEGKFEYNMFNNQENYLYIANNVSVSQIIDYFVNVVFDKFILSRCKLWRLEEEKRIIFVNWIKGKIVLFNNNQKTNFTGELIDSKNILIYIYNT